MALVPTRANVSVSRRFLVAIMRCRSVSLMRWGLFLSARLWCFEPEFFAAAIAFEPFKEPLFWSFQACVNVFRWFTFYQSFDGRFSDLLFHVNASCSKLYLQWLYMGKKPLGNLCRESSHLTYKDWHDLKGRLDSIVQTRRWTRAGLRFVLATSFPSLMSFGFSTFTRVGPPARWNRSLKIPAMLPNLSIRQLYGDYQTLFV